MKIRLFYLQDLDQILSLFYQTVHSINKKNYSPEQLNAWAPKVVDKEKWLAKLQKNFTLVAEKNGQIVGFADLTPDGQLDHLYVHKDFQGQGIASKLLELIENEAKNRNFSIITTESSITAKPFFEKHGFKIVQTNQKERRGEIFKTYSMEKSLLPNNLK